MNVGAPVPPDPPQTLGMALRQFGQQLSGLKRQAKLAGQIERELEKNSKALLREAAHETLQARADATPPRCPDCGAPLEHLESRGAHPADAVGPSHATARLGVVNK